MSRMEDRQEMSRLRAEANVRRRKMRVMLFVTAVTLYVLVPLVWYGAVEFEWIHPIRTPEFKSATNTTALVLLLLIIYFLPEMWRTGRKVDKSKSESTSPAD